MAVAEAALPSQPAVVAPSIVARLTRSRLADAVICSFLSSIWILLGAFVAADVGMLGCGEGCPTVHAALQIVAAAVVSLALVTPVTVLLLLVSMAGSVAVANLDEEKARAPARESFAAVAREMLRDPVIIGFLLSGPFVLLMMVGVLLKDDSPASGSRKDRIGSLFLDLGTLGSHLLCFFIHSIAALRLWRVWKVIRLRQ